MSLISTMNIGRLGVYASQVNLSVAGNNIANVDTDGYTRQRAVLAELSTGGVTVEAIERLADSFVPAQLRQSNARIEASNLLASSLEQMESALGQGGDAGLTKAMQDFFSAMQDLSTNPSGNAERSALIAQAELMISNFKSIYERMTQLRDQLNSQIEQEVGVANQILTDIADINSRIVATGAREGAGDASATNQLLDKRDQLANELSEVLPIRVLEGDNGAYTIFGANEVLIDGVSVSPLALSQDFSNDAYYEVGVQKSTSNFANISDDLSLGRLGAAIVARDEYAKDTVDELERIAATMMRDVNIIHREGVGLDGVGNRNFFESIQTSGTLSPENNGELIINSISVAQANEDQLDFHDYEIRFNDPPNNFDIVDVTTDTVVAANQAYVSGGAFSFRGIDVTLSDGPGGPAAGDVVSVNTYDGTIELLGINSVVANDTNTIAAGLTSAPGDNENILRLAALRDTNSMGINGTATYESSFDKLRLDISLSTQVAQGDSDSEQIAQQQLVALRDSVSGVSLDEEATNILQFQRMFEASSRVINAANEMLVTLIQIV